MSKEKTRFSDEELQEFKELINRKLEEAKEDLMLLQSSLSPVTTMELMILEEVLI